MRKMLKTEYDNEFGGQIDHNTDITKRALAWDKAWEIRNFEIEMYWKRATYFWAFQVAIFAGYAAFHEVTPNKDSWTAYLLSNIGIIISVSWYYVNKGSKFWQQNWESHIDLLENEISGPLYKTVNYRLSSTANNTKPVYSVSKINEKVSLIFIFAWLAIAIRYWVDKSLFQLKDISIDWFVAISTATTLAFVVWIRLGCMMQTDEPTYASKLREPSHL